MSIVFQRLVLILGLLLLIMGYAGFILLADLSRQFFRQDVSPWQMFSMGLAITGLSLLVAWFVVRVMLTRSRSGEGKQLHNSSSD
ncbi:MAG: hypothetical protein QW470_07490 [Candidatus Caldarchaeum sp.]